MNPSYPYRTGPQQPPYAFQDRQENEDYDEDDSAEEGSQDEEGEEGGEEGEDEGEEDHVEVEDAINEGEEEEEEEEEEDDEDDDDEEKEEEEEEEEEVEEEPELERAPSTPSAHPTAPPLAFPVKPMTVRQRKEKEKIARQIERQQKKELKEREKAERQAKREKERLARVAKKEQGLLQSKSARKTRATVGDQRAYSIGRPAKSSNSNSQLLARKIKVDGRVETVRKLVAYTETGELRLHPPGAPVDPSVKTRWCDTKTYQGVTYFVEDDELTLPNDPKGDTKVTADGVLLGGRQYKIPTFTSKDRTNPNKHFMLSIDAARAAGYRDSLYFFRRNPLIQKLPCTQPEKDELICAGFLSGNLKSRAVTMCSARNAFKVMGARFLKDGKHVIDDYYEDAALASGAIVGEAAIADGLEPQDRAASSSAPAPQADPSSAPILPEQPEHEKPEQHLSAFRLGLNRVHPSANGLTTSGLKTIFGGDGKAPSIAIPNDSKERRRRMASHLTVKNWMTQYCRAISEMNRHLRGIRNERMIPFCNYPSVARMVSDSEMDKTQNEDDNMEWREVEVDMRLNTEGKIMEPGDGQDGRRNQDDDNDSNSDAGVPATSAQDPSQVMSRITNALPPESIITIHGLGNPSGSQQHTHSGESSAQAMGGADASRTVGSSLHPARARSPNKRFFKSRTKKAQNDWWTTTVKIVEQRPKRPAVGLLDVHTGQPHVRQDTQPTMATWESAENLSDWSKSLNKRRKLNANDVEELDGHDNHASYMDITKTVLKLPLLRNSGLNHSSDISLIEAVLDESLTNGEANRTNLLPGMWDFRSGC